MEAKVAKTLLEAYASVYDQPEQIDEGITSVVNSPQDKNKGPGPTYKGPRIKMGPGEGGRFPKKKEPKGGPGLVGAFEKLKKNLTKEDVDVFDIVKGYLMSEGLTEEEALQKMVTMTEEERQSIVEAPIHPAEAAFNKSTPEERAANTKKYGTPYRPLDTSRRSGDPTAPAWMRGGFKSRDEYNKLDQATKDLLN